MRRDRQMDGQKVNSKHVSVLLTLAPITVVIGKINHGSLRSYYSGSGW